MQEINAWLKKKDFETGKALYLKYGANSFFKTLLSNGPTPFNIKKLGAELSALAPASPAKILPVTKKELPVTSAGTTIQNTPPPENPKAVSKKSLERHHGLKELRQITYRQMERNMMALDFSEDQAILHSTAKQILALHAKVSDIHDLLDYYEEHNEFPEVHVTEELIKTPEQELQLLYQSTSKAKGRIKSGKCRDVKKTKALIETNNLRIAELLGKDEICL